MEFHYWLFLFSLVSIYAGGSRDTAADGLIVISGGGPGAPDDATDNGGKPDGTGGMYYGTAVCSAAKDYWASVAMGDSSLSNALYGTAVGVSSAIGEILSGLGLK